MYIFPKHVTYIF